MERVSVRFNFRIVYRPGKLAARPDALSRKAEDQPLSKTDRADDRIKHHYQKVLKEHNISPGMGPDHITSLQIYALDMESPTDDLISNCYSVNADVQDMLVALKDDSIRQWPQHLRKKLQIAMSECKVIEDRIYYRDRLLIPEDTSLRLNIMTRVHGSAAGGHVGRRKTTDMVKRTYFWPGMTKDIDQFVRHCHLCTRSKVRREAPPGFLKPLQIPFQPWSNISVDYITGLPACEQGGQVYRHILVVVDRLTKMWHFIPCVTLEAEELAERFITAIYSLHGLPENIVSDRGSQFVSML
jgi:Integrase zinc binding domain